jgi:hypothetical protein
MHDKYPERILIYMKGIDVAGFLARIILFMHGVESGHTLQNHNIFQGVLNSVEITLEACPIL